MTVSGDVISIKSELLKISNKGGAKKIFAEAKKFDDLISNFENIPDAYFGLWLDILSDPELYNKQGMHVFVMNLQICMHALSEDQKEGALHAILSHYSNYNNLDTCWHVGDLIARCYKMQKALNCFKILFPASTEQGRKGIALGLDVLRRQDKGAKSKRMIEQILRGD
ncbi:hypothetical protein P5705_09960 [Pseudomonas entomophila]|uniref:hypothetical protein n=1 Tax=Pseudomonas entomophila TaxID=312306 RepID=UPI002406F9A3|nr:hypothetical protein [Pseudomonas entomophila]MDF9617967.1 hypothetical protein [Pseudomonas entomophila]